MELKIDEEYETEKIICPLECGNEIVIIFKEKEIINLHGALYLGAIAPKRAATWSEKQSQMRQEAGLSSPEPLDYGDRIVCIKCRIVLNIVFD